MSNKTPKVVIVMPAYNAERTVKDTYHEIPKVLRKHIILVDDHSRDNTVSVARELGIKVFSHTSNLGYGGNQKTCYWEALKLNPDVVVMLHPDYQYDASMVEDLIAPILKKRFDFMFGSRIANKKSALSGGMPTHKYYINRIVCFLQNIALGTNFTEQFSGFRAFSKSLLTTVPFGRFSNDFVFDQEMTISALSYGFRIGEIAIPTRYHQKASSIQFLKGSKFILEGFLTIAKLYLHNLGFIKDSRFAKIDPLKHHDTLRFLFFVSLVFLNLYVYGLLGTEATISLAILLLSIFLYLGIFINSFIAKVLSLGMLLVMVIWFFQVGKDSTLLSLTPLEEYIYFRREEYLGSLGKIYKNSLGVWYFNSFLPTFNKLVKNLFDTLSFVKLLNFENLATLILVPPFLIGLWSFVTRPKVLVVLYFVIAFGVSALLAENFGLYLFLPLVHVSLYKGAMTLWRKGT